MKKTHRFGGVTVEINDRYVVTRFPDGSELIADTVEQPGQAQTAADLGFGSAREMNAQHDLAHSWLAHALGLPFSPTLHGVAAGKHYRLAALEEAAVLAVQRWAKAAGMDIGGDE